MSRPGVSRLASSAWDVGGRVLPRLGESRRIGVLHRRGLDHHEVSDGFRDHLMSRDRHRAQLRIRQKDSADLLMDAADLRLGQRDALDDLP
jgi:hypothetical protein